MNLPRLSLVLALGAALAAGAAERRWSPDELIVLNGLFGFGDCGTYDTAPDVRAPGNTLGFSLRVDWQDHPGEPTWWSIRHGLPAGLVPADYDTVSFDLRVERNQGAKLTIFFVEPSDNRWVVFGGPLADLPLGEWRHFEVPREQLRLWQLSANPGDWAGVRGLAIEPNSGAAVFYLDNLCLKGPHGKLARLFDTADDGLHTDPSWHEPVQGAPAAGTVYLPFDGSRLDDDALRQSAIALHRRLGAVGVPMSGLGPNAVRVSRELRAAGLPVLHYATFGGDHRRFLTRRGAWDMNLAGRSCNDIPGALTGWDWRHTLALAHPAVDEAQSQRIDALLQAGISTFMVVDYVFPWPDGPWGYSATMQQAFRADLQARDAGLFLRGGGVLKFADYFRAYHGFAPEPAQLGYADWSQWVSPRPDDPGPYRRARWSTFWMLRSYEWLKLPDRTGRHYRDKGGQPLWIVPNPEDSNASSDYWFLLRSQGVGNLLPEWFGPIGWCAEAAYASLPALREVADRAGSRLSIIHETGAGGHSTPYLDWRVAYSGVYALTASGRLDDFDNDFLDEAPVSVLAAPAKHAYHFNRFRDGLAKAAAFQQARREQPQRPPAPILCVSERPPAKACGSFYFGLGQPHSLAVGLSRAHLLCDVRDSLDLEQVLDRYALVAYSPWAPRPGDLAALRGWLTARPGRVLVTHSFVPTRSTTEFWGTDPTAGLGGARDGDLLGLGAITRGTSQRFTLTRVPESWRALVPVGRAVETVAPLCRSSLGEPVVVSDAGPVVSRARVGESWVYYLHYAAGDGTAAQQLDAALLRAIAAEVEQRPFVAADFDTLVQRWTVPGGQVLCAWDAPTMGRWNWRYEPGLAPLAYDAPGVARTLRLPAGQALQVYDFWRDQLQTVAPDAGGTVALALQDSLCGLWYAGAGEAFQTVLRDARERRRSLREWER